MSADATGPVTRLLAQSRAGDREAFNRLLPLVYEQLRAIATNLLRGERPDHTLRPTGLVHEAYLRLVDQRAGWQDRHHFFAIAAQAMRRVLVDYARAYRAEKRGGHTPRVSIDAGGESGDQPARDVAIDDIVEIDTALRELETIDAFEARVVELRYFGGHTVEETAAILGVSPALVKREWSVARAWLFRRLSGR